MLRVAPVGGPGLGQPSLDPSHRQVVDRFGVPLGVGGIVIATVLVVLAAIAGAGTPGIVSLAMISIVFGPLGLPSTAIVVLLLAVNAVIEPVTTMTNIFAVSAATAFIAGPRRAEAAEPIEATS